MFRKSALFATFAVAGMLSLVSLGAGIIMEDRPIPFAVTDNVQLQSVNLAVALRTSFGQVLAPGTYLIKLEGTGKPNEVILSFYKGLTSPASGKTKGSLTHNRNQAVTPSSNSAPDPAIARGFQEVDPRQSFSSLGFSTMSQIRIGPDGPEQKISIETANHSLNYVIEAKLPAVQ